MLSTWRSATYGAIWIAVTLGVGRSGGTSHTMGSDAAPSTSGRRGARTPAPTLRRRRRMAAGVPREGDDARLPWSGDGGVDSGADASGSSPGADASNSPDAGTPPGTDASAA